MQTCPVMQRIVTRITAFHGVDITTPGAYLKLEMAGALPLHLEHIGRHQVAVSHTFLQHGDVMRDPEVVFFIGAGPWVPISITQDPVGSSREYAELSDDGARIIRLAPRGQAELASFATLFARNLAAQGWLTAGRAVRIVHGAGAEVAHVSSR